jgi:hypothetical protein
MSHSTEKFPIGTRVRDIQNKERGAIEEYRKDDFPLEEQAHRALICGIQLIA